jgi:hypothetical protein
MNLRKLNHNKRSPYAGRPTPPLIEEGGPISEHVTILEQKSWP